MKSPIHTNVKEEKKEKDRKGMGLNTRGGTRWQVWTSVAENMLVKHLQPPNRHRTSK